MTSLTQTQMWRFDATLPQLQSLTVALVHIDFKGFPHGDRFSELWPPSSMLFSLLGQRRTAANKNAVVEHQSRVFTEGAIPRKCISRILHKSSTCTKLRGKPAEQKIADLPSDRLSMDPLLQT